MAEDQSYLRQARLEKSPISWLRERDVDLLLCAELHADSSFARFLANRIGCSDAKFSGAWVSHAEIDGETDLVVAFSSASGDVVALVENKIAAAFQPLQGQRYKSRAERWLLSKDVSRVVTVLIAPESYFSKMGAEIFDVRIGYEDAVNAIRSENDSRSTFLAHALNAGVDALRRGYVMNPDEIVTSVWVMCWKTAQRVSPRLHFKDPGLRPGRSTWIYFREAEGFSQEDLKRVVVTYKAERGQVDLQFAATERDALIEAAGVLLDQTMQIVSAAKSASIRINVPIIDFTSSPEDQAAAIIEGLAACERLRALFIEHRQRLRSVPMRAR